MTAPKNPAAGVTAVREDAPGAADGCGTPAGAQQHRKRGEPTCRACKDASAAYMRELRSQRGADYDKWWNGTYAAAQRRLVAEYPDRFAELLAEVRKETPAPWDPGEPS